ncbi:hypothetical protein [Lewinella sp. JB7]|uniref:hypothetical protein n=1 Tax=Lewinella sp. JB7 TaxID=2962887 RepID=UPI0020C9AAD4|nr:hypothetical protein [Lewinella sp. JB7]MCP9234584.1 hypothetical protein [Lewinella sp. JB7]
MNRLQHPCRLVSILLPLAFLMLSCSDEQQLLGVQAERQYVDLLYHLHAGDESGSVAAVRDLEVTLRQLRRRGYRPLATEEFDRMLYHVDRAECAFEDARNSIEDGDLSLAEVQLDRAVYELSVGDAAVFNELYVGSIYDFVALWLEVDHLLTRAEDATYWDELIGCGLDARAAWQIARRTDPSPYIYPDLVADPGEFQAARERLTDQLQAFRQAVKSRDRRLVEGRARQVNEAFWDLLRLFGTATSELAG